MQIAQHKVRVVILKQWKKPKTIYKNLMKLNKAFGCNMTHGKTRKRIKPLFTTRAEINRLYKTLKHAFRQAIHLCC